MDSIADLYKHFKRVGADIASITREQIIAAGYEGDCNPDLIASDVRRMHGFTINPPKSRRKAPKRQPKDTGRRKKQHRNSAAAAFSSQMSATLELMDRANGSEVEDNPLQLFNTAPNEQYPRFVVIRPETPANVLNDLAAALPDTGYRQISLEDNGVA